VVLAHGGQSHGYALYLQDGAPCFATRVGGALALAQGRAPLDEGWTHLAGVIAGDGQLLLYVDGELAATDTAETVVQANPNEGIEIGMDAATKVGAYTTDMGFVGAIDEVRLHQGALKPEAIRKSFGKPAG